MKLTTLMSFCPIAVASLLFLEVLVHCTDSNYPKPTQIEEGTKEFVSHQLPALSSLNHDTPHHIIKRKAKGGRGFGFGKKKTSQKNRDSYPKQAQSGSNSYPKQPGANPNYPGGGAPPAYPGGGHMSGGAPPAYPGMAPPAYPGGGHMGPPPAYPGTSNAGRYPGASYPGSNNYPGGSYGGSGGYYPQGGSCKLIFV